MWRSRPHRYSEPISLPFVAEGLATLVIHSFIDCHRYDACRVSIMTAWIHVYSQGEAEIHRINITDEFRKRVDLERYCARILRDFKDSREKAWDFDHGKYEVDEEAG